MKHKTVHKQCTLHTTPRLTNSQNWKPVKHTRAHYLTSWCG